MQKSAKADVVGIKGGALQISTAQGPYLAGCRENAARFVSSSLPGGKERMNMPWRWSLASQARIVEPEVAEPWCDSAAALPRGEQEFWFNFCVVLSKSVNRSRSKVPKASARSAGLWRDADKGTSGQLFRTYLLPGPVPSGRLQATAA